MPKKYYNIEATLHVTVEGIEASSAKEAQQLLIDEIDGVLVGNVGGIDAFVSVDQDSIDVEKAT